MTVLADERRALVGQPSTALMRSPLCARLSGAKHVLLAGAGGGYDVFCALPLFAALRANGIDVHLANLTFTYLADTSAEWEAPALARVSRHTVGAERYFPERALCEALAGSGDDVTVHCFDKVGVEPLRAAYRHLVGELGIDAIVLVDGGTDILMRGDEPRLGTPEEDMTSLAAVHGLTEVSTRLVACLGFGIDAFHGVEHAFVLEAVAELQREGAFLGAFSLLPTMPEARLYLEAVAHAASRFPRGSIVNASIASALEGGFGDVQRLARTEGSELFINPLMCLYWAFELEGLAKRSLYLPTLEGTQSIWDVSRAIEAFRATVTPRRSRRIPL